jgi:RNA polymerase sigma-70 factor (ECF subfamily)
MIPKLLERVKTNERKALHEFYQKFSVRLFRSAYRYVTNEQDAGSIVNMSFFKIFNHIHDFDYKDEKNLLAWMNRIVINEALMLLRQRVSYKETDASYLEKYTVDDFPDDNLALEEYYQMIRRLPDDLRTVFNMFVVDGFSHNEIAAQLNIQESSSRVYLTRARKILQDGITKMKAHYGKEHAG